MQTSGGYRLVIALTVVLALLTPAIAGASAGGALRLNNSADEVCDPLADYFLGMEDYPEALRRHLEVIREHPGNALAHYHLGFIYGMMGEHEREMAEYQKAIDLGLSDWQLFLNLGLLDMERGDLSGAAQVLNLATLLGPQHPETHFNLGLVYERRGMLRAAEQQMLYSLRLDPEQPDARNMLGVIYAKEGDYQRAEQEWSALEQSDPRYTPAVENLSLLRGAARARENRFSATRQVKDSARP